MSTTAERTGAQSPALTYRIIWRWHFYAGLFCIPFIIWLSVTGAIYLFKPQFEAWQDEPFSKLSVTGPLASAEAQVNAALAAVPGSTLNAYELSPGPTAAARVIVGHDTETYRVYLHPQTLAVLSVQNTDDRFMSVIHDLHGRLYIGDSGSLIMETAASWAIVMLVTGLYLWWPRGSRFAGVLYPRLKSEGRLFWRDLHAVIGFWVSVLALFLLVSGLPWAHFWGSNLKAVRQFGSQTALQQDWSTGKSSELAEKKAMNTPLAVEDEHAHHHHHPGMVMDAPAAPASQYAALDRLVATVAPLGLAPPVRISPPSQKSSQWTGQSLAQNRLQRVKLTLDPATGAVLTRSGFDDKLLLDKAISVGVAAHEGQLFGWFNQALGVFTTLGLILLSVSGFMMWFKRRPAGALGAPRPLPNSRVSPVIWTLAVAFSLFLPLLGITAVIVWLVERSLLRRIPRTRDFLGLQAA